MKISGLELAQRGARSYLDIHTDAGVCGSALLEQAADARLSQLANEILMGADPRAVSHHWTRLTIANERHDRALSKEIAALDIALWDLRARLNEEPLWRTLGGLRPKVNVHARLPDGVRDGASLRTWCDGIARDGIRGVILAASDDMQADAETLVALREALGDGAARSFMLDANERWSPKEAVQAITALEEWIDLTWVESPVRRNVLGMKRVSEAIRGAVCAGGQLTSCSDFLPYLHQHAINVVQIDITRVGMSGALQIADAAYGFELPIALAPAPANIQAHLAAALPYCSSIELSADRTISSHIEIENGWAVGRDGPGHGLRLKEDLAGESRP